MEEFERAFRDGRTEYEESIAIARGVLSGLFLMLILLGLGVVLAMVVF
jgi:hypothetical protein